MKDNIAREMAKSLGRKLGYDINNDCNVEDYFNLAAMGRIEKLERMICLILDHLDLEEYSELNQGLRARK